MLYIYLSMLETEEDKNKFRRIYDKYKNLIYRISYNILKNHHLAEDAIQETFLILVKHINKMEKVESVKTKNFIAIISRNKALDILKKESKHGEKIDLDEVIINEELVSSDIAEYIVSKLGYEKLLEIMNRLEPIYKDTLKLRFIYHYTNEEISELLSISKHTVEVRISRGRVMVKEALSKEGEYV